MWGAQARGRLVVDRRQGQDGAFPALSESRSLPDPGAEARRRGRALVDEADGTVGDGRPSGRQGKRAARAPKVAGGGGSAGPTRRSQGRASPIPSPRAGG